MNSYETVSEKLAAFVQACDQGTETFQLTPLADATPYARCFAIFVRHLLRDPELCKAAEQLSLALVHDIRMERTKPGADLQSKQYRQLLTFSLSALAALPNSSPRLLDDLVAEQLPFCGVEQLEKHGCLIGRPGSGNQAMFMAIFLLHGRNHLGVDTQPLIDAWVDAHMRSMNRFGFWGNCLGMTHLQFQNGYHQHEVIEYLGLRNPYLQQTLSAVRGLADSEGHFAPYPGGGGCYDYDAVFMLTPEGCIPDISVRHLLMRTAATIVAEQQVDGGFAESIRVRPRSFSNFRKFAAHVLDALGNRSLLAERLHYGLTLQRPKHDRVHTHWSQYSRRWDESDLWDTWFRMLTLARIDVAIDSERAERWGFIDYPGIGYHPSLKKGRAGI